MTHARSITRALAAVALALASTSSPAFAQPAPSPAAKLTAEALFVEGRRLVAAGQYADACPKFADSQRLDPSPATLLNLASCYEKLDRTATAWATYREAASAANASGRSELVATAQRHSDALSPHLSRQTIAVAEGVDGLEVKRDGVVIDRAEWGTPLPLDPGTHVLTASAPGRKGWTTSVDIPRDGAVVSTTVPPLEPLPPDRTPVDVSPLTRPPANPFAVGPGGPTDAPAPSSTAPAAPESHADSSAGQRIAGWVMTGAGVASLAVAGGFTIAAKSRYDASLKHCESGNPNLCDPTGIRYRNEARTQGDVASWTVGAGAVLAAVGLVVVLTAPRETKGGRAALSWRVAPTLGGATMEATW
ncbi:MAG: hypothetical protein FWD17_09395 [Polyangiaceae bacterium]|nr:hypothetical protein [Polyangiaceae bacterium]